MNGQEYYRWYIVNAVLAEKYRFVFKWTLYDYLELSSHNGLVMLANDNRMHPEYMVLILQKFDIALMGIDRYCAGMNQQMKESGQNG